MFPGNSLKKSGGTHVFVNYTTMYSMLPQNVGHFIDWSTTGSKRGRLS